MVEQRVEVGKLRVRYLEAGKGAPVIFGAGLGISADFYEPNLASLARAGFRALAPDLPGTGKTRGGATGVSVPAMTEHLRAFAQALEIAHAHWIGHSLGCQAVLALAARYPHLVARMVLAGPTGGYGHRLLHQARGLAIAAVQEPRRLLRAVLRDYARLSPFNYLGTWMKAARHDPLPDAVKVRVPVLIVVGKRDRVPGLEFIAQLQQKLGNARVLELPAGQHGLPLDAQREFDRAVLGFLRATRW